MIRYMAGSTLTFSFPFFRLVLSSCSSFLRDVFLSLPQGLPEFTLIIPNIKQQVVKTLIDFLYTVRKNIIS